MRAILKSQGQKENLFSRFSVRPYSVHTERRYSITRIQNYLRKTSQVIFLNSDFNRKNSRFFKLKFRQRNFYTRLKN